MKILCLLVVLANIFLWLWEYRIGRFETQRENPQQQVIAGTEKIYLLSEREKQMLFNSPSSAKEEAVGTNVLGKNSKLDETKPE